MNVFRFLTNKGVRYAILLAIFYQVAMVFLYIYGYHVLPGGINQLGVGIVNQDGAQGAAIQKELATNLPFDTVVTNEDLTQSRDELNNRQIQMIIVIPQNFVANLQTGKASFDFYINESNTPTAVTTMESVAKAITDNFNQAMSKGKLTAILKSLNVPDGQQKAIATSLQSSVVQKNVYVNSAPSSMGYTMAPAFLSIAAYASSMVASIVLMNILLAFIPILGRWKAFAYVEVVGCVIALGAPLCGILTACLLISVSLQSILMVYLQQAFMQVTTFQFTLFFSLWLGQNGLFVNIPLLLMQTIAGGGTMPLQIMPALFKVVSYVTPMYPSTQANFGVLFGGPILPFEGRLLAICLVSFLLLLVVVQYKKGKSVKQAAG